MKRKRITFLLLFLLSWNAAKAADNSSETDYFQEFPVVLSASRLSQPLSEAPNAMTVIDRKMIDASGFRIITDLFKLVPGMYVSYYKGSQAIVSYHGTTDPPARRMQVMIDGRSIYMPPTNTVDWASLPVTIDDIERIEVIRGPAAASYGANSTQGVINIITRDAGGVDGGSLSYARGSKGINDASARFGRRGETFDYRMTIAYTADNGYDNLSQSPNSTANLSKVINNSNDSNQARLMNYRANYHPNGVDSFDVQAGYNHDVQGVGFNNRNPTPANPKSTNGDPFHDLIAHSGFVQLGWLRLLDNSSELSVRYHHALENQYEAFPVYLFGVYFPGPVTQAMRTQRDNVEVQHTLQLTGANRLVYGAAYQIDRVDGVSNIPPLTAIYSSSLSQPGYRAFAHDEWRISPELLLNAGGMFERDRMGNKNFSPRVSLNYHVTPQHTFRTGVSVAYRTPSLTEERFPVVQPGTLFIPSAAVTSPGLKPEKITSREIGYLGEFPEWGTILDLRLFSDLLVNGIYVGKNPGAAQYTFVNELNAEYRGFEATIKQNWNGDNELTLNFAHELARSNAPAWAAAGNLFLQSSSPSSNDMLTASIPKNSASLLYSRRLPWDVSFSAAYYYQDSLQPFDRSAEDFQPIQRRMDARIAKAFHAYGGIRGNVSFVVQDALNRGYTEYIASNLFNRRAYVKLDLNW